MRLRCKLQRLICSVLSLGLLGGSGSVQADVATRPNIILVIADDMGWGDAAVFGHPYLSTPNIDALARQGTRFTQFYVNSPICSPSRAAFMTGQYPARFRIHSHFAAHELNAERGMPDWLDPKVLTVTRLFQAAGYVTGHFGKWHLGHGKGAPEPGAYGIDRHITYWSNGPQLQKEGWFRVPHWYGLSTRMIMDDAIAFLRENKDKPFYLNIWPIMPHAPIDPTPEQLSVYQDLQPQADHPAFGKWTRGYYQKARDLRGQMQVYGAAITDVDAQIGRLMDTLRELGLDEKTLVVFSSDNGPEDYHVADKQNPGVGSAGLFRGRKRSIYEGGVRTPLVVRWKGHVPAGVTDNTSVVAGVDFLPTVAQLAGVQRPAGTELDGEDLSDILLGQSRPRRTALFFEWLGDRHRGDLAYWSPPMAVRDGEWKLLLDSDGRRVELYNVVRDPGEETNLAAQHPDVTARLSTLAKNWRATLPATSFRGKVREGRSDDVPGISGLLASLGDKCSATLHRWLRYFSN